MGLSVAVLGRRPAAGVRGMAPWGAWATQSWADPTSLATDSEIVSGQIDNLLVLTSTAGAVPARIAAATVAAVRPDIRVRVEVLPVSLAVLVRAVETVPSTLTSPTAVFAAVTATIANTTWGAWLPSVAKLEQPTPTLGQHVQSWFARGAGFIAIHGSPGWVAKLPQQSVSANRRLPRGPSDEAAMVYDCHAFGDAPEDAIAALFAMGLSVRPARREAFGDAAAIWGNPKAVEFVITPTVPVSVGTSHPDFGPYAGQCPACDQAVWGSCCPFCRIVPRRSPPPSTVPAPTTTSSGAVS